MSRHLPMAEDDPDIRVVSKMALKRAGYRVTAAATGREVLERVAQDRPDAILRSRAGSRRSSARVPWRMAASL